MMVKKGTSPALSQSAKILLRRIEKIIEHIPRNFPQRSEFVEKLRSKQKLILQGEPGQIEIIWNETMNLLRKYTGEIDERVWVQQIWEIFSNDEPK